MKNRRKDETTKNTKIFGITLGKANANSVDGEECFKKNQHTGPHVQELIDNIMCEAMAMENKKPSMIWYNLQILQKFIQKA